MSSSLLLQQCPACFVHPIWMVIEMWGRWPYSCSFIRCCLQDLFNVVHSIFVHFPSSFFSICLVSVNMVHPFSRIDTTAAWKKMRLIVRRCINFLKHCLYHWFFLLFFIWFYFFCLYIYIYIYISRERSSTIPYTSV